MPLFEAVRLALSQIRAQKLKSFFTLLGVTIGTMFLIAVVSVVNGMGRYVEEDFAAKFLGVNTFNLRRFPDINVGEVTDAMWREWQKRPRITEEDAYAVRDALPAGTRWAIDAASWETPRTRYALQTPQVLTHAATPDIFAIKDLVVERGRAFNEQEEALGAPVAVIGKEVAEFYFPNLDPIGREIRFGGVPFTVIGVLEKQGSVFGISLDRQVVAPYQSPLGRQIAPGGRDLYGVIVQAENEASLAEAREVVREVMRRRHGLRPAQEDDFAFETSESALGQWQTIKRYLVLAGIVLPAIGLVVGAIVIMNIMLVAVAERTREIDIRKALGAKRRDIVAQFLVESATLSAFGAIVGIGLGYGLAAVVKSLTPMPASVATWSVIMSVVLGAGVGIIAGIYPARRASRLDPILAMRSE
ncbi:MAG TPA: ABC transporter permease [Gemmatimonadaceae bacterium]|nr:ABC transporter permease [Gemmatimonadaceae bacterium]